MSTLVEEFKDKKISKTNKVGFKGSEHGVKAVKLFKGDIKKSDMMNHHEILNRAKMHGKMRNNYLILEEIGNREYGEVFKCQYQESMYENKLTDSHIRAVKINTKSFMTD